jgi:tetratricopeptide (TPR) repeat protein
MSRPARLAAILFVAALCAPAAGHDPWVRITSANFELFTTARERAGRDLARHFEQVRSFFLEAFGSALPGAKPIRIVAFRNEKEYQPYRPSEFATAFCQPGDQHDFIIMSGASREEYHVAVHEFTHLMVHQGGASYPVWLNEGLAELFSNLEPAGNKIKVGQDIPGRMISLRTERWIPLATLLTVDRNSPIYNEKSRASMFYAESWELVHMLFLSPEYAPQLKAMAAALKQSGAATAFETAYHKSIPQIEADLQQYLSGGTIKVFLFAVQLPKSIDTPEIEPHSALSARIALAELLTNYRGRVDEAQAAYASLAKDFPRSAEVEEGWGQFCWRLRKLEDAAKHYARAVSLGGKDERLFLAYGRVLEYTNKAADAIQVLGKGAEVYPDSDEIRMELGALYVRNGNYGAAVAQLRAVKKAQPAQAYRLFYNQAFAEFRLGQLDEAKVHAAKARTYTHNPAELSALDRLDRQLPAQPRELPHLDGTLENLECGKLARLHIRADNKLAIFVMPDPAVLHIQCGPQDPPRAVHIQYQAMPATADVSGVVRSLEFK